MGFSKVSDRHSGRRAEDAALVYLTQKGLIRVERNYRCAMGEIDLIMRDGAFLAFVEVRFRSSERFGGAVESVNWAKRKRIAAAASHYLASTGIDAPARFDVVAMSPGTSGFSVNWIKDAFRLN